MEAIILSRRDFREHDQIISAYTKEEGKVELLARGVKKIMSKNTAHLEPFSYVDIAWVSGKELDYLTTVQPYDLFVHIRQDFEKSLGAWRVVSLVDTLIQAEHTDSRVFALLLSWLQMIDDVDAFQTLLVDAFVMKFFDLLGFRPVLDKCVVSGVTFQDIGKGILESTQGATKSRPGLYFQGGGLIAPEARSKKELIGEEIMYCGLKEISTLQIFLDGDWQVIEALRLDEKEAQALHQLVYAYALYHSEKKVSDWI